MNRRNFFGILGVGSAFVAAPVVAYAATRVAPEKKPPGTGKGIMMNDTIVLQGSIDEDIVKHNGAIIGYFQNPNKNRPQVKLAAGGDSHLWLQINNEWKRVVVE